MNSKKIITVDFYRAVTTKSLAFSVLGVALFCFISIYQYISINDLSQANVIDMIVLLFGLSMFKKILIIFASIPIVSTFCQDWNSQYIRSVIIRVGSCKYILSKILVCHLVSFSVIFVGMLLFLLVMSFFSPLALHDVNYYVGWKPFGSFLLNGQSVLYIVLNTFIFSFGISLCVVLGMTISAYIPNQFVAIVSPFIVGYLMEEFTYSMPAFLNLFYLTRVQFDTGRGNTITFLYYIVVFELLIAISGFLFAYQVKRRVSNEVV